MHRAAPSVSFAILLWFALLSSNGATPVQQGDKVVIVVKNDNKISGPLPLPAPLPATVKEKRADKKSLIGNIAIPGLKRLGQVVSKHSQIEDSASQKKEKSLLTKLLPTSSRHVAGPTDLFRQKAFGQKSPPQGILHDKRPHFSDFRPHQPDITPDLPNGNKLSSFPGGFNDDQHLTNIKPLPTPMANKLNPFTNGVAASFPPGIDPYEGFIRYAAENLDTPVGNVIDYHSLEHYYGPQHPLNPHYTKEVHLNHPYADSFNYNNNNNGIDASSSPPAHPPPPPSPPYHHEGFRGPHNPRTGGDNAGRLNHPNSLNNNNFEHGVDHFHATSPGHTSAPPRPIPPTDPMLYDEGPGQRSPPVEPFPQGGRPAYGRSHRIPPPPFKYSTSSQLEPHNAPPPDLDIYDEGPPLAGDLPPDGPDHDGPTGPGQHAASPPENHVMDGGDDAIWGILDLAEMLQKGQIPGATGSANNPTGPEGNPKNSQFQNAAGGASQRIVVPIFNRPPPPRQHQQQHQQHNPPTSAFPADHDYPGPPSPPHGNSNRFAYSPDGYDYDETPAEGLGGNQPLLPGHNSNNNQPPQFGHPDSQEGGNDYADDLYKK